MADRIDQGFQRHRTWILLTLLLIAGGIAVVVLERRTVVLTDPRPIPLNEPDFIMDGAVISQYDTEGALRYRLTAEQIRHFEAEALTGMLRPNISLHDAAQPPWQVSARKGTLHRPGPGAGEEIVKLEEEVILAQTRRDGRWISLSTHALVIYPDRQFAETDQDVTIDTHIGRTTATGLKGDFRLGTISLTSTNDRPVHTVVKPEQFK
jgi:lipopolysaccharide export system protein LptC